MRTRSQRVKWAVAGVATIASAIGANAFFGGSDSVPDLSGTLNNDIVAIGGETTGWGIHAGEGGGFVEVDVGACLTQATGLCGKPVRAWGTYQDRRGVERGYRVFVVSRVEAGK